MSMYVFAPAGPQNLHNEMMRIAVEYIGSQDSGFGSSWAKGKRYLKGKLGCSGTAVKRACVIKNKYINHDFEEYGAGVYYYQKDDCARIVKAVCEYLVKHCNFADLLEKAYGHRISQAEWVRDMNYKKQGDAAEKVCKKLNSLR